MSKTIGLVVIQSKRHIITITSGGVRYKLFQICFNSKGDIYVDFPYYKSSDGIVGRAELAPASNSVTLNPDCAKITSHRVKYAHHVSGEAHFSKTGKVRPLIKNTTPNLKDFSGHLFTVMLQGIENFDIASSEKYNARWTPNLSISNFDISELEFESLKFVAIWDSMEELGKSIKVPTGRDRIGPQYAYKDKQGVLFQGMLFGPEKPTALGNKILCLGLTAIPKISKTMGTSLTFLGGFKSSIRESDPSKNYSFLAFIYPHIKAKENAEGILKFESTDFLF